jgi:putative serine protease PepD
MMEFMRQNTRAILISSLVTALVVSVIWWYSPLRVPKLRPDPSKAADETTEPSAEASASVPMTPDEQINIRVYKENSPGVANITSKTVEFDFFFEPVQREGTGSGSVINYDGDIVTNYHVIEKGEQLEVTLPGQTSKPYRADVVGADPLNDIAVIRIKAPKDKLHPVKLGDSTRLQVGQKVLAIGNPFKLQGTLTTGVISALDRTIRTQAGTLVYNVIQTDAAINQGNSGGPLLNASGEMIGVNTMIFTTSGGNIGIGFAIPVTTVKRVVNDLIKYGKVIRPWLGVIPIDVTPDRAEMLDLPVRKGVLVRAIERGSPAAAAGIRPGRERRTFFNQLVITGADIIVAIDGKPVDNKDDLLRYLEEHKPNDKIRVTVVRDGERVDVPVKLEEEPGQRKFKF